MTGRDCGDSDVNGPGDQGTGAHGPGHQGLGGAGRPRPSRPVISSVTGKRIAYRTAADEEPVLADRVDEDRPDPREDESNDARLLRDVPPHWGGRHERR